MSTNVLELPSMNFDHRRRPGETKPEPFVPTTNWDEIQAKRLARLEAVDPSVPVLDVPAMNFDDRLERMRQVKTDDSKPYDRSRREVAESGGDNQLIPPGMRF